VLEVGRSAERDAAGLDEIPGKGHCVRMLPSNYPVAKIRTESALNPLLWFSGLALAALAGSAYAPVSVVKWLLCTIVFLTAVIFLGSYLYLLRKDPDRLQSEHYQLSKYKLLGDNRVGFREISGPQTANAAIVVASEPAQPVSEGTRHLRQWRRSKWTPSACAPTC
jgi:hypothetical protein